jgi:hypothetical protein
LLICLFQIFFAVKLEHTHKFEEMFVVAMQIGYNFEVFDDGNVTSVTNFEFSEADGVLVVVVGFSLLEPVKQALIMYLLNCWWQ